MLWQSLDDRPIQDRTASIYREKAHEIFLFLQDHWHILNMEGRFPLSVGIYQEMMDALDKEMRRSYSAGALVGALLRLLPQFIDALSREIGSFVSQGVRARFSRSRRLSSGVGDSASVMEFCDYWELERDHRGILMDELGTDDVDEMFPWGVMLDAMNRAKVKRADEWYRVFTVYHDPVDFSEFLH